MTYNVFLMNKKRMNPILRSAQVIKTTTVSSLLCLYSITACTPTHHDLCSKQGQITAHMGMIFTSFPGHQDVFVVPMSTMDDT